MCKAGLDDMADKLITERDARRKAKRKLRAAERRRSRKEKKMAEVKVEAATAPAPATETRPKEDKVQGSSMLTLIPYTPPSN